MSYAFRVIQCNSACSDLSSIPLKSGHSVVQRSSSQEEAGSQDRDKAAEWGVRLLYTGEV